MGYLEMCIVTLLVSQVWGVSEYSRWQTVGCTTVSYRMTCRVVLPDIVPPGIKEVVLQQLVNSQLHRYECVFCNNSWASVEKLKIANDGTSAGNEDDIDHLKDDQFKGLHNLVSLTISLSYLYIQLPPRTFAGLENLTTLDMSDCLELSTNNLFKSISNPDILPKLSILVLHNINTLNDNTITLTQQMVHMLSNGKNITEIDLSATRIMTPPQSRGIVYYPLCETLKLLNISSTLLLATATDIPEQDFVKCNSLTTVDIGGFHTFKEHIPRTDIFLINERLTLDYIDMPYMRPFDNVRTLYARDVLHGASGAHIYIYNSVFNVSLTWEVKHLYFSRNRLKWMDGILVSNYIQLEFLDLSHNEIEYIAPRVFQQRTMISLVDIKLSHNMLSHMESNGTELEALFASLMSLETLDVSHNNMSRIPKRMFIQNTHLRVLNLSNNKLTGVEFEIAFLTELNYLDISVNDVLCIDSTSIDAFNHIYVKQSGGNMSNFKVNLYKNPLRCSACADVQLVRWVATSPVVFTTGVQYTCMNENHIVKPIDENIVHLTQFLCHRTRIIVMATLIPVSSIALIVLTVIYVVKRVKKRRFEAHADAVGRRIENDDYEFAYPVFLSYSSLDDDVVLHNLYPEFLHHLRVYCRTERELVCFGDRHFRPGGYITNEVVRCLEMSALLVVVMSKNYCDSDWCIDEVEHAQQLRKPILIISLEHVDVPDMPPVLMRHFQTHVRVKFAGNEDGDYVITPDWDNVCFSILGMLP